MVMVTTAMLEGTNNLLPNHSLPLSVHGYGLWTARLSRGGNFNLQCYCHDSDIGKSTIYKFEYIVMNQT